MNMDCSISRDIDKECNNDQKCENLQHTLSLNSRVLLLI